MVSLCELREPLVHLFFWGGGGGGGGGGGLAAEPKDIFRYGSEYFCSEISEMCCYVHYVITV